MVKPNASGMGSTARFRGILQKGKRTERSSGRFCSLEASFGETRPGRLSSGCRKWARKSPRTSAPMANSGPKSCKTIQNLEGASDTRPPAGQIKLRPQLSGFGWRARRGQLGTEVYLSGFFGRALGLGSAWLDEVAGEQAGGVALGGVLLEALHQLKARLG